MYIWLVFYFHLLLKSNFVFDDYITIVICDIVHDLKISLTMLLTRHSLQADFNKVKIEWLLSVLLL